jgi:pyrroline-5-carboxylate reductase
MIKNKKITIIGSGNMGEALLKGLIQSGSSNPEYITCSDTRPERLAALAEQYRVLTTDDNTIAVGWADIVVYAVKPQVITTVLQQTASGLDRSKLIISLAAGIPIAVIEACVKKELRLIRAMPNVGAAVLKSATAIAAGRHCLETDSAMAKAVFDAVGETVVIEENPLMDAVTGLSGSGPAFIFVVAEAMADAGVKMGLTRQDARSLAIQTILGAAVLLKETGEHPGELKDKVASPGGTTIAGLCELEAGGLRTALINAVEAATNRSGELGRLIVESVTPQTG